MDRSHELSAPYMECPTECRLASLGRTTRLWVSPLPLRLMFSGFKSLGVCAPCPPKEIKNAFTLNVRGTPSLLSYPGSRHWLVATFAMPEGSTPEDPFAGEPPHHRVDGVDARLILTLSSRGLAYLANVDIGRASLTHMAARVLDREPDSRILVRLLPRYAKGAVRWFPEHRAFQFWAAI
jgi:hypothetical protein